MKRFRIWLLLLALLAVLIGAHYYRENQVRVEKVSFHSQLTGTDLSYNVILPRGYGLLSPWRKTYPVLYLLHGHGGNSSSWLAHTHLTEYVANLNVIVVTPEGLDGWYTDSATVANARNETYIVQELIPDVERRFRTIRDRQGRAIAGYSMGGYGALKFGLKYPELFVFAGSMSGAFDAPLRTDEASILTTFGPAGSPARDANNLMKLVGQVSPAKVPYLYLDCGKADPWLGSNRELVSELVKSGIKHNYEEVDGGHDWAYWERRIPNVLQLAVKTMTPAR
jgi:S-formylglutathione hydrolase FrmB